MAKHFDMNRLDAWEVALLIALHNNGMTFDSNQYTRIADEMCIVSERCPHEGKISIPECWNISTDENGCYYVSCNSELWDSRKIFFVDKEGKNWKKR